MKGIRVVAVAVLVAVVGMGGQPQLQLADGGVVRFSGDHGGIEAVCAVGKLSESIWHSGEGGLWLAEFEDGVRLNASRFGLNDRDYNFSWEAAAGGLVFNYRSAELEVRVTAAVVAGGVDLRAELTPAKKVLLGFALPGRMEFNHDGIKQLIFPHPGGVGVGVAFNQRFFQRQKDNEWYKYQVMYPEAFADFMHLKSAAGEAALFGVQPRVEGDPWQGAQNHELIFVPGILECGSSNAGGYCSRAFGTYVKAGSRWRTPVVRMLVGQGDDQTVQGYAEANRLDRPLASKVRSETLARLKQAPLLYLNGSARQKMSALDGLSAPVLIHFADYLKGGFDKEYPDHLPPNEGFGTAAEMREFFVEAQRRGHLISPYTNPTWWCDNPRGETFKQVGEEPLLRNLKGEHGYERYNKNDGWSITLWHPAVQAANRKVIREFTQEYPVDLLFQDQCGARHWRYDTSPHSPTAYAYAEGMLAMNQEDSARVALATESGWDQVANYQSMLCGLTWGIVPADGGPEWVKLFKTRYPADSWEIYPLALKLMHDKVLFTHHDLGHFVTSEQILSWTLGLGFSLSYRATPDMLRSAEHGNWFAWLARLQRSVCARYAGEPVRSFRHDRTALLAGGGDPQRREDDGTLVAEYGEVRVACNLGDTPRVVAGRSLPAYGFYAEGPGVRAGTLESGVGYVAEYGGERKELWLYGRAGSEVAVELPFKSRGQPVVKGAEGSRCSWQGGKLEMRLPVVSATRVEVPEARGRLARSEMAGERGVVALIDLGGEVRPAGTGISFERWLAAVEGSELVREHKLKVERLTSYAALAEALAGGSERYFAIINPYGEIFPAGSGESWRQTLDAIRNYVNHGGVWWETAAYSFYKAAWQQDGRWQIREVGPAGTGYLQLPVGMDAVAKPAEALQVTEGGRRWLGAALAERVAAARCQVNRGTLGGAERPVTTLVSGAEAGYIGGYRLDGWGTLWRVGGFNPDSELMPLVAMAVLKHHYTSVPEPLPHFATRYLYHLTFEN